MSLAAGTRLGSYEITAKLGEGGMGEVYRATDSKLKREVAIKVLPAAFTADPERLARFEREAQLLAQLNHPNIAQIYGLEASGEAHALVMELVEGPTLAERLEEGPLPFHESLSISLQIAQALEEAHEKGIVHRDLKPQNIKASIEGKTKVLDFGLAKAMDPAAGSAASAGDLARSPTLMNSPTLTAAGTQLGVILGTAAYMSPEQARGQAVDKRSDIWSFGVVLWEMLTGARLFAADTVTDTLASVLRTEIDPDELPPTTPPAIRRLLRRCLERNRRNRLHDVADARIVLDEVLAGTTDGPELAAVESATGPRRWLQLLPWALAAGLAALLLLRDSGSEPAATAGAVREARAVELSVPRGQLLLDEAPVALAPDASAVVFGASDPLSGVQLWLRRLDRFEAEPLAGTEGGLLPFWSPDSQSIGFFRVGDRSLCLLDLATGRVQALTQTSEMGRGGAWGADGTILFAPTANAPIFRIAVSGGEPGQVTDLDPGILDGSHRYPVWLPDGEHFLFTLWTNHAETAARVGGVYLASLEKGILRRLTPDMSRAVLAGTDRIVVRRDGALVALPFDSQKLEITGRAEEVADDPLFAPSSGALSVSATAAGDLAFALASGEGNGQLVWLDRRGETVAALGAERLLVRAVAPAPTGGRFAVQVASSTGGNILVGDERRQVMNRVTREGVDAADAVWSPDGGRIAYGSEVSGKEAAWVQPADGSRPPEMLVGDAKRNFLPTSWSADGRYLFLDSSPENSNRSEIWLHDIREGAAREVLADPTSRLNEGTLSPDGRWLAYTSDEAGNPEVYVRSFPELDRKWKISQGGATQPHWRDDGRELVFVGLADRGVHAVSIAAGVDGLEAGIPQLLFAPRAPLLALAPAADHSRFLAGVVPGDVRSEPIHLVLGWRAVRTSEELR